MEKVGATDPRNGRPSWNALAEMAGLSTSTITKMVSGTRATSPTTIRKVADALRVRPEEVSAWLQRRSVGDLYEPPAEAAYLTDRQRKALDEMIRSMVITQAEARGARAEHERMLDEAAQANDIDERRIRREAEQFGITVSEYGDKYDFDYEVARAALVSEPTAARPGEPLDVVRETKIDEHLHETQDEHQDMEPR